MKWHALAGPKAAAAYPRFVARAFAGLLLIVAKNGVRRLLRRQPEYRRVDRLAARHWLHLIRLRPIDTLTVTNYVASEGPGSRTLMTIFAMGYCRAYGLTYRHTPFRNVRHADRPQEDWDRAWEAFFNLGQGELPVAGHEPTSFDLFELNDITWHNGDELAQFLPPHAREQRPVYYFAPPESDDAAQWERYQRQFVELIVPLVPALRAKYRAGAAAALDQPFTVAVHIRRGDVLSDREDMWTSLDSFGACLDIVTACLRTHGIAFRLQVFSQGVAEDFAGLARFAPEWHLDTDPLHTLRQMIDADILVMSKSSYSYVAALLSDGIKIFEPCPIPPLDGWIMRSADGSFDPAELTARLASGPTGS